MLEWGDPRDMALAPKDGRQILLLLSNGWLVLARYPKDEGEKPASERWNVWWRVTGGTDILDPATVKNSSDGLRAVGWWNVPNEDWCWETAQRLRGD